MSMTLATFVLVLVLVVLTGEVQGYCTRTGKDFDCNCGKKDGDVPLDLHRWEARVMHGARFSILLLLEAALVVLRCLLA
jgi:hypothetical protein